MTEILWVGLERISRLWIGPAASALIGSSLVIILVACATRWLHRRPAALRYGLWGIVLLRLLVPPQLGLPIPLGGLALLARDTAARWCGSGPAGFAEQELSQPTVVFAAGDGLRGNAHPFVPRQNSPGTFAQVSRLSFVAWLSGVALLTAAMAFRLLRICRTLAACRPVTDSRLLSCFEKCRKRLGITGRCRLYLSDRQVGPCAVGILRPAVIFPAHLAPLLEASELEPLLLHELAHVRRCDTIVIWLQQVAQILYWPNPLAWMANRRMHRERELACDELVLSFTRYRPRDYGAGLIKVIELGGDGTALATGLLGAMQPHSVMHQRLQLIMDEHRCGDTFVSRRLRIAIVLGGLAALSAAPTLATSGAGRDEATGRRAAAATAPATSGGRPAERGIVPGSLCGLSEISPENQARILAACQECFPQEVWAHLPRLQRESSRELDPSGKLPVNMLAKSIDHDLNLWTGIISQKRNRGRTITGEIKLSNTSATDPLLILTDGGVVLPHRLTRWKDRGPGEYELHAALDRPWPSGEEKSFHWVIPSGQLRNVADGEYSLVVRNLMGPEGIQQLMLILPAGLRTKNASDAPHSTVRVGERVVTLWQRHVQADEDYRVEVILAPDNHESD